MWLNGDPWPWMSTYDAETATNDNEPGGASLRGCRRSCLDVAHRSSIDCPTSTLGIAHLMAHLGRSEFDLPITGCYLLSDLDIPRDFSTGGMYWLSDCPMSGAWERLI